MRWWGFLVVALASYRLTRIITTDTLLHAFREHLYDFAWDDEHPVADGSEYRPSARAAWRTYLYELLTCPWCLGVWVSAGVYSVWRWWDVTPVRAIIVILAVAGVQGFLASRDNA